jgi:hypothetical protein
MPCNIQHVCFQGFSQIQLCYDCHYTLMFYQLRTTQRGWCHSRRVPTLFPERKGSGSWRWPPTSRAEVKERVKIDLYSRSWPSLSVLECNLPLPPTIRSYRHFPIFYLSSSSLLHHFVSILVIICVRVKRLTGSHRDPRAGTVLPPV